uniref:L domain-like protein n=1 Tax=Trichobilharzia regenti TaxID=157069 RepID=A0AA85JED6_TRIRE|nr:unnamed protein product [Trichobilharzia regenti]
MQTVQLTGDQTLRQEDEQNKIAVDKSLGSVVLNKELISSGLCCINETIDGLSYAPAKFICNEKLLTDIDALKGYIFLRYINLGFNRLTNLKPLYNLTNLIVLRAAYNEIEEFPCGNWPTLTHLDLSHNRIKKLSTINYPRLMVLSLDHNQIRRLTTDIDGLYYLNDQSVPKLHTLGLSHNLIEIEDNPSNITIGLELKNLKALFLGYNRIISFGNYNLKNENLENASTELSISSVAKVQAYCKYNSMIGYLPNLSVLHIRSCGLVNLDGITIESFPKLQYLNVRQSSLRYQRLSTGSSS